MVREEAGFAVIIHPTLAHRFDSTLSAPTASFFFARCRSPGTNHASFAPCVLPGEPFLPEQAVSPSKATTYGVSPCWKRALEPVQDAGLAVIQEVPAIDLLHA